jgi:hypothetical protein
MGGDADSAIDDIAAFLDRNAYFRCVFSMSLSAGFLCISGSLLVAEGHAGARGFSPSRRRIWRERWLVESKATRPTLKDALSRLCRRNCRPD